MIPVNRNGQLRFHLKDGYGPHCKGSRRSISEGAVSVRHLADGIVIKVRHRADFGEPVTDELVLAQHEWDELVRLARGEL